MSMEEMVSQCTLEQTTAWVTNTAQHCNYTAEGVFCHFLKYEMGDAMPEQQCRLHI